MDTLISLSQKYLHRNRMDQIVQRGGEFLTVKDTGQTIDVHRSKMNFENESIKLLVCSFIFSSNQIIVLM